jgi:hypothetical protein
VKKTKVNICVWYVIPKEGQKIESPMTKSVLGLPPRLNIITNSTPEIERMLSQPMIPSSTTYVLPRVPWYLANGLIREFKEDLENVDAHKSKMQDCFAEMKEAHEAELSQTSHDLELLCHYQSYCEIDELMKYIDTLANDFWRVESYIDSMWSRYGDHYSKEEFNAMTENDREDRDNLRREITRVYKTCGYKFLKKCASMRREWDFALQNMDSASQCI